LNSFGTSGQTLVATAPYLYSRNNIPTYPVYGRQPHSIIASPSDNHKHTFCLQNVNVDGTRVDKVHNAVARLSRGIDLQVGVYGRRLREEVDLVSEDSQSQHTNVGCLAGFV
jgi:hypothetical protein